jgi:hypothetical protein
MSCYWQARRLSYYRAFWRLKDGFVFQRGFFVFGPWEGWTGRGAGHAGLAATARNAWPAGVIRCQVYFVDRRGACPTGGRFSGCKMGSFGKKGVFRGAHSGDRTAIGTGRDQPDRNRRNGAKRLARLCGSRVGRLSGEVKDPPAPGHSTDFQDGFVFHSRYTYTSDLIQLCN